MSLLIQSAEEFCQEGWVEGGVGEYEEEKKVS